MSKPVIAKSRRALAAAAFALSLIAAGPAGAAVICVPASCDGTCTSTAASIQLGIDAAAPGNTVLVCPGIYPEMVTPGHGGVVPGSAGIDIDKSLTLKSLLGAAVTTITNGGGPPGGHCLPTSCPGGPQQLVTLSASGITIDGLTILETDPTVNLITADGDAVSDNHVIKNNVITNPTFDDGNTGGGWGILLGGTAIDGADGNLFDANEISLNPDPTKNQFTFGIGLAGGGADSNDNNTISNNFIHDTGFGAFGDANDTNTTVSGNKFLNNAKVGFQDFGTTTGGKVMNNTFTNAGRAGLEIRNGATGVVVQNNCFSKNGSAPPTFSPCPFGGCTVTPFGAIRIEDDSGATTGTMIHNNNFDGNNVPNGITDNSAASTNTDGEAENNWWGCAAGPGNVGCDSVTANVDFTPFLTSQASGPPCPTPAQATATPTETPQFPTPTPIKTPGPLRHFQCYEEPREPFPSRTVSLADQFGPSTANLIRRNRICNPASKNDEDPNALTDPNHLTGYVLKPTVPFEGITDLPVTNQFGSVFVDVIKPEYLLVPAAKDLMSAPGPLANPAVDHFQCYRIRKAKTRVSGVKAEDELTTMTFDVKKPLRLCSAANKNGEGVLGPAGRLVCYKVRQTSLPKFRGFSPVFIDDQFGAAETSVDHVREFCVPSSDNLNPRVCPPGGQFNLKWNGALNRQKDNNCYNYGTDLKTNTFAQPGLNATNMLNRINTCKRVKDASIRDGLIFLGNPPANQAIPNCPGGTCLVALVVDPTTYTCRGGPKNGAACENDGDCRPAGGNFRCRDGDYHWYRRNADDSWTHKPGGRAATDKDVSNAVITDPRTANRDARPTGPNYTDFCGFMCVTGATAIRTVERGDEARDVPRVASNEVDATIFFYSGIYPPGWTFTSTSDINEIQCRLNAAIAAAPGGIPDPNWEGNLGFGGLHLTSGSGTGLPEEITTFLNDIEVDNAGTTTFYPDVAQLGELLRCRAITEGFDTLVPSGSCGPLPPCP